MEFHELEELMNRAKVVQDGSEEEREAFIYVLEMEVMGIEHEIEWLRIFKLEIGHKIEWLKGKEWFKGEQA
jgi:hypothetical protein